MDDLKPSMKQSIFFTRRLRELIGEIDREADPTAFMSLAIEGFEASRDSGKFSLEPDNQGELEEMVQAMAALAASLRRRVEVFNSLTASVLTNSTLEPELVLEFAQHIDERVSAVRERALVICPAGAD